MAHFTLGIKLTLEKQSAKKRQISMTGHLRPKSLRVFMGARRLKPLAIQIKTRENYLRVSKKSNTHSLSCLRRRTDMSHAGRMVIDDLSKFHLLSVDMKKQMIRGVYNALAIMAGKARKEAIINAQRNFTLRNTFSKNNILYSVSTT